jgi:pyruvate ferredoxin oxidoreductase beta subunit
LAVETRSFVLYEYEDGEITINKLPKKKPIEEYLMKQGRFSHLSKAQIAEIQEELDENFNRLTAGRWS